MKNKILKKTVMSKHLSSSIKSATKAIAIFAISYLGINNQSLQAQQFDLKSSKQGIDNISTINSMLKNGGNPTVNALDSIPTCSAVWIYGGATGVIPDTSVNGLTMNFNISDIAGTNLGTDVNFVGVYLNIQHYRIGDISVRLVAPNGTSVQLVERMGYPATLPYGCTGKNINATFLRGTGAEAENECNVPPPALKGLHSAVFGADLNDINLAGGSPNGVWKLKVTDSQLGEVGYVLGWKMYFDQQPPNAAYNITANGLFVSLDAQNTLQGNATYIWDFGNGDSAVGQNVIYQYPFRGQYTIKLLVIDACGTDTLSNTYSLEPPPCFATFPSTTTPTPITDNNPAGDTLTITTNQVIGHHLGKDVDLRKVCIKGTHPRMGDLKMKLISPGGVEVYLLDRPYYPFQQPYGCLNANFDFCIGHGTGNDAEVCNTTGAAVKGEFTAIIPQDLRAVNDLVTNPNGVWKLVVYDMAAGSTGVVTEWSLLFDTQDPDPAYTYTFQGLTVDINSLDLPAVNYRWDFGDGTPFDLNSSPSHTYASPGKKTITVYTDNVCSADTLVRNITLYDCEEEFTYPSAPVPIPDLDSTGIEIPFTIAGIDGVNLGVDAFITRVCFTSDHVWPGDLKIQLIAPNGKVVPLINQPTRALTIDGCGAPGIDMCIVEGAGNDTRFTCDYDNAPPAIGGFYTATAGYPLESINQAGGNPNGVWRLRVIDYALFHTGNITSWKLYFGKLKPNVDFSYTSNATGLTSFTIPNAQTSYLWVFDNGDTSTSLTPTHQYLANGIYPVKLLAIDTLCLSDSLTKDVYITSFNNGCISPFLYGGAPMPIADADSINGTTLNFNVSGVLGDTLGVDVNLFRVGVKGIHGRVGDLKMKLIAPNGSSTILVDRPGYPNATDGCEQNDFQFIVSNGQGVNLEDACNETGFAMFGLFQSDKQNDLGTINFAGGSPNGNWQLVVYDMNKDWIGQINDLALYFDGQPTHADFIYNIKTDTVLFRHAANSDAKFKWNFGDGTTSQQKFPSKIYADTGYYAVQLIVTDSCGIDSITQVIHIEDVRPKCVDMRAYIGPKGIANNNPAGVYIKLNVTNVIGSQLGKDVRLVKVRLKGTTTRVSDLTAKIIAPNGVAIDLFNRVGYPAKPMGCERDNFDVSFVKGVGPGAENNCNLVGPALAGTFNAAFFQDLNDINVAGGSPNGTWYLFMSDLAPNAIAKLETYELYFDAQGVVDASFTTTPVLNSMTYTAAGVAGVNYSWNFGDATTGTGNSVNHAYSQPGLYTVTCYAKDSCRTDSTVQVLNIKVFNEPTTCTVVDSVVGLPLGIPNGNPSGINLTINTSGLSGTSLGLDANLYKVKVMGTHPRVGDIIINLTAPNGQMVTLIDRPGYPTTTLGCSGDDFNFEVVRGQNASVENVCFPALVPTITGAYSASNGGDLDSINIVGGSPNGLWTINVVDANPTMGGGQITGVELYFENQTSVNSYLNTTVYDNSVTCTGPNDSGVSYLLSFGDGYTDTVANSSHTYPIAGTYTVSLKSSDTCGFVINQSVITVGGYPTPLCPKKFDFITPPVAIPDNDTNGVALNFVLTTALGTNLGTNVDLVQVCINGTHTNVGDLSAKLIAPNGAFVYLMDRPGYPVKPNGCTGDDFDFCIIQGAGNPIEGVCNNKVPTMAGTHTAVAGFNLDSLNLAGGSPNGTWTLLLYDLNPTEIGTIDGFSLRFDNQIAVQPNFTYTSLASSVVFEPVSNKPATYIWSFGDATTSTDAMPVHNYAASGSYTVTLVITDPCGTDSSTQIVTVTAYPEAACTKTFPFNVNNAAIPDNDSTGITILTNFSTIDGTTLGSDVNLVKVRIKGLHTNVGDLRLTLRAPNGVKVDLMNQPGVPATIKGCEGDDFDFTVSRGMGVGVESVCDVLIPTITGDYTSSSGNPLDNINLAGGSPNGQWKVFAYDFAPADTGSILEIELIFENQNLTNADFTYTLTGKDFQGTSVSAPNATYSWQFGNGDVSSDANPLYTYPLNGNYQVTLTVTDSCGIKSSTQNIAMFAYDTPTCVQSFEFTGLPVTIPNLDSNGVTVTMNLTAIDGTTLGSDVNLVQVCVAGIHPKVGDLKAVLIAPNGAVVTLMDRPGIPGGGCNGDDFDFCVERGINYSVENVCEPTKPTLSGIFSAQDGSNLDSINIAGGSPNGNWQVIFYDLGANNIGDLLSVHLLFDNQNSVDPTFTYLTNGGAIQCNSLNAANTSYNWTFSDGFTSTDPNPLHVFVLSGTYTITLVATDSCGTDSSTQSVVILAYPPEVCTKSYELSTTPVNIPDNDTNGIAIQLNITDLVGTLGVDMNLVTVCLNGAHTNVGDLKATLIAPNGIAINLMDRPGYPATPKGCTGDDFDFCVYRGISNDIENTCNPIAPALSGSFSAVDGYNLDSINIGGGNPNGIWTLIISDLEATKTGQVLDAQLVFDNQPQEDANFTYVLNGMDFIGTSANVANTSYLWSFGNGDVSSDPNPIYTYPANGYYTVTLTATDSCGYKSTSQDITLFYYAEATCVDSFAFNGLPVAIPNNNPAGITVNTTISGVEGTTLGSDVNLVQVCISGTHTRVGDLRAVLVAPNGAMVELMDRPGIPVGNGCPGDDFDFCVVRGINNSIENVCNLTVPALTGIVTASEGYNLDSINIAGGSPNGNWQVIIYDLAAANAGSLVSVQLLFDNQSNIDPLFTYAVNSNIVQCTSANAPNTNYSWTFSDGFTSTDANPVHAFALTGTYTITLVASDSCGMDSSVQSVGIVAYAPATCTKDYEFTVAPVVIPDNDLSGTTISLNVTDASGTLGFDVSLVSICINGVHTNVGDLKATLIAPNGKAVNLMDRPGYPASSTGCTGDDFNFCVERGIGAGVENSCNVTAPAISGQFTAETGFDLDSINIGGGSPNGIWQLKLYDLESTETGQLIDAHLVFDNQPQADATFNTLVTDYTVNFNSLNQSGINYNWDFGDGNGSTNALAANTYLSNGTYTVTLTASDSCGSIVTSQTVTIAVPLACARDYNYSAVPVAIPDNDTIGVTSVYTLNGVSGNTLGTDVRLTSVCVTGTHTNVGDLLIQLTAPNNKMITLMDRPGYPATATGCDGSDFDFCLTGGQGFDNENACNVVAPAISGSYSAVGDNLDSINYYGGNPNGNWTLNISDNNANEVGVLTSWKLQFNGQPPIADFTYVINGSDVTFTAPTIPNATYTWNFGDLATSNLQNPTHTYAGNGNYQVVLTVTDSCGTSLGTQLIPITVGINNLNPNAIIQVVPNPASSFIDLKVNNVQHEKLSIFIINGIGQNVFTTEVDAQTNQLTKRIECGNWSKGIYYVKLVSPTMNKQQKLIIQ